VTPTREPVDPARLEAFGAKLLDWLNHAGFCLMASIGHRTGLFDAMRGLPPSTSSQIARAANLHERYVREWLGAMWGEEQTREYLTRAGFTSVETHQLAHDVMNNLSVARK
jgi:hypothetical protein